MIDPQALREFEERLEPWRLERSRADARVERSPPSSPPGGRAPVFRGHQHPDLPHGRRGAAQPELFLASAPRFLRWLLRLAFLDEVMSRYYDPRRVFLDLVANLFKEGREELMTVAVPAVNDLLPPGARIAAEDVRKYYAGDKLIWSVFLAFRKLDRWVKTRIAGRRYEFVLPGKIAR